MCLPEALIICYHGEIRKISILFTFGLKKKKKNQELCGYIGKYVQYQFLSFSILVLLFINKRLIFLFISQIIQVILFFYHKIISNLIEYEVYLNV